MIRTAMLQDLTCRSQDMLKSPPPQGGPPPAIGFPPGTELELVSGVALVPPPGIDVEHDRMAQHTISDTSVLFEQIHDRFATSVPQAVTLAFDLMQVCCRPKSIFTSQPDKCDITYNA